MLQAILGFLSGGIVKQFTDPLLNAYEAKLKAENDTARLEAEKDIQRIEAARDIALAEVGRAWSATSLGRWLIVVPFGIWWFALWAIQVINPWFGLNLVVIDVPPHVFEMAKVLVPAIILGDASTFAVRRFTNR